MPKAATGALSVHRNRARVAHPALMALGLRCRLPSLAAGGWAAGKRQLPGARRPPALSIYQLNTHTPSRTERCAIGRSIIPPGWPCVLRAGPASQRTARLSGGGIAHHQNMIQNIKTSAASERAIDGHAEACGWQEFAIP